MTRHAPEELAAYAYPPDGQFRKMLGDVPLRELFTPEKIRAAQKVMDNARDAFFIKHQPTLLQLQSALQDADEHADDPSAELERMRLAARTIMDQARLFGFSFIVDVSGHLLKLCGGVGGGIARSRLLLLGKLAEVLNYAFSEKIRGDGGKVGRQLLASLEMKKKG